MMENSEIENNEEKCIICGKLKENLGEINWERHLNACERKRSEKEKKKKDRDTKKAESRKRGSSHGSKLLTTFFKKARLESNDKSGKTASNDEQTIDLEIITEPSSSSTSCIESLQLENDDILIVKDVLNDIVNEVISNEPMKCRGYRPGITNMYSKLTCHTLSELNIVIENEALHNAECSSHDYRLQPGNVTANKCCTDLEYTPNLQKLISRCLTPYGNGTTISTNHVFLSHAQLSEKAKLLQEEKRNLRLQLMSSNFKYSKLCTTLSLHERFLLSISENNVPRLQQLVNIALKNHRSIGNIVNKVSNAIDGIYMPHPSQDDKDLAFLVLKFGGPSLLNILYSAGVLPSVSTAYKMAKQCPPIASSVKSTVSECFDSNISISEQGKALVSLKMDETFVTPTLAYNSRDNQAYGSCYQHGSGINLTLNTYQDCVEIQEEINDDNLHIPKECLVAGLASLNENRPLQPLLMWPTCSKKDEEGIIQIISEVNDKMKVKHGFPLMNVGTDGDSSRRIVTHKLTTVEVDDDFPWFQHIANLPLVDYVAGPDGITTNFDPKHMSKRCWVMLLREKIEINGITLTKPLLKELLKGNSYGVGEDSLYPKDKQNVKSATSFLLAFIESAKKDDFPYNLVPIKTELLLLADVFEGLLSFFVFTDITISDQLKSISTSSYILYHLYKEYKTSLMPSQLYHDLQSSFIDALFSCAKAKEYSPDQPFYLLLDGTDLCERFFGNVRLRFKGSNYNTLDMINSARAMAECDKLLVVSHPEWTKKSRVQQRLALDYSNPASWKSEQLMLGDVNIHAVWKSGYYKALSVIPERVLENIENANTSLRCPVKKGVVVGVKNCGKDWSLEDHEEEIEFVVESTTKSDDQPDPEINLSEIIQCPSQPAEPFFMIDGKRVYKTTCLKSISAFQELSKDRLRRVQGMSKYPGDSTVTNNVDSYLLNGDPVLVNQSKDGPKIANILKITKANRELKFIDITQGTEQMKDIELTLCIIETQQFDNKLFWKGTTVGETFKSVGEHCLPIKPCVDLSPPEGMTKYFFDIDLIRDMGVHLQLSNLQENPKPQQPNHSNQSVIKKKCFKCKKMVPLSDMRCHVGVHILKSDLIGPNLCGFCGRSVCSTTLKKTSKKGSKSIFSIDRSDCEYFYLYGRSKKFNRKSNTCTNRIDRCPIEGCLTNVWKYNFSHHFQEKHSGEIPLEMIISDEEKRFLRK